MLRVSIVPDAYFFSVEHWHSSLGIQRSMLGLMLVLFLSMSFLWEMVRQIMELLCDITCWISGY